MVRQSITRHRPANRIRKSAMSPSFRLLLLVAVAGHVQAFSVDRLEEAVDHETYTGPPEPYLQRLPRAVADEVQNIPVDDEDKEVEVVTDPALIKSVEDQSLPVGEYDEISPPSGVGRRGKRGTITVIRIRNRRTGAVTYVVIRRR